MATGSWSSSTAAPTDAAGLEQARFIERQINRTRRQVKLVELGAAAVTLVVGVLAFFLMAALVDHWLLPLSGWGRGLLLLALGAGVAWYLWTVVAPLLRHSINPAYAALTIEQSAPSLKNSLINFLLLRGDRSQVHDVVYEAVQQRAATDLQQVPLETVVDYSRLIKVGYALAAIFALCAAYKVLSPKDPFQTAARVAAPWADIARPSRVQIESVSPGDAQQFFGDSVTISAKLRGVRSDDRVALLFSTADGQVVDQALDMTPSDSGDTFTVKLPGEGHTLQQDVTYRIEAGDAVSRDYTLTVVAAPTIVVEKVEYDFPRYTQKPRETRERAGDLRALEGTRVTLHARANQPIQNAFIEFDTSTNPSAAPERVAMQTAGDTATGSFVLELEADRVTPKHGTYQITFTTASGHAGQHPAVHTIDVIRDLSPEIEILQPEDQTIDVPENGSALVEMRAIDPDFALSRVGLKLTLGGQEIADKSLLDAKGQPAQSTSKFRFRPKDFDLKAGAEVAWWGTVADNRTSPTTGLPEPNTERTKNYFFRIVAADPNAKQAGDGAEGEQPMPGENNGQRNNDPMPGEQGNEGDNVAGSEDASQPPMQNDPMQNQPMNDMGGDSQDMSTPSNGQQQGSKSDQPMQGEQGQQQDQQGGAGESGNNQGQNDKPMSDQGSGEQSGMSGGADAGNGQSQGNPSEKPEQRGKQDGDNQGSQPPGKGSQDGASENNDGSGQQQGNQAGSRPDNRGQRGNERNNDPSSGPREEPHDGEVFEKALERMLEQAEREQSQGGHAQPKPEQGEGQNGNGPTQEDFDRLSPELKEKLKSLLRKQQEQGGGQKTDQAPPGVQQDQPQEGSQGEGNSKPPMGQGAGQKQGDAANNQQGTGETGKSDGAMKTKPEEANGAQQQKSDEPRQGGLGNNGESGAGQTSNDKTGAAQAQEANRDKPKSQQSGDQPPSNDEQAQSPSGSKKQSDSQGGESGDRSGGGKKGPGQSAKAAGNDAAGSNSAADEGAGAAKESGEGETAQGAGDKKQADGQTGQRGSERGNGSTSERANQGERSADGAMGEKTEGDQPPMPAGEDEGEGGKTGDFVTGGGKPSESSGRSQFADAAGPAAEKAKIDYAKDATDLVLEYLKDQKDQPDQQLLDELGWTKEDLDRFLKKWAEAKREAAENPSAKRDLDEALRSLGLRPTKDTVRRAEARSDNQRGLGDVGPTSGPPSKYLEQFRAFKKGAARQ